MNPNICPIAPNEVLNLLASGKMRPGHEVDSNIVAGSPILLFRDPSWGFEVCLDTDTGECRISDRQSLQWRLDVAIQPSGPRS